MLLDSDKELSDADLSNFGSVDMDIEEPHIKLNTKIFQEALKSLGIVSTLSGRDMLSRSILFDPTVPGKVTCTATDFDVFFSITIPIENNLNVIQEKFVIPYDVLIKLMKAVPAMTIIYMKDGQFFIYLLGGGSIVVENLSVDTDKYVHPAVGDSIGVMNSAELFRGLRNFSPLVVAAVAPAEKRVMLVKSRLVASHFYALIESSKVFSGGDQEFDIRLKNIKLLTSLLNNRDEEVMLSMGKGTDGVLRVQMSAADYLYTFLVSDPSVNPLFEEIFNSFDNEGVSVDFLQIYKMTELAAELPYSSSKVALNYGESGLSYVIKTRKEVDAAFNIESTSSKVPALAKSIIVQAKLFRLLLRGFQANSTIVVTLSSKGLQLSTDTCSAYLVADPS